MSDSRLEKFIYAICSMDVSDLPVPLSRIEKLWNCLITGETPDFEPLSRNEKYLMAMLDRYDISNLPAPMSRGEKLLYKITVGETDLSDVPGYLSQYEELLKYLIENGGISGGDFEYVLYTLNQSLNTLYLTAEKPVKSAILKGQTLNNLADLSQLSRQNFAITRNNNEIILSRPEQYFGYPTFKIAIPNGSVDKKYTVIYKCKVNQELHTFGIGFTRNSLSLAYEDGYDQNTFTPTTSYKTYSFISSGDACLGFSSRWRNYPDDGTIIYFKDIIVIEGEYDVNNMDIPYFEGMQSVKMPVLTTTGKNLFDYTHWYSLIYPIFDYEIVGNKISTTIPVGCWFLETNQIDFSELKMNTVYTMSGSPVNSEITILFWKPDGAIIFERGVRNTPITFRTPNEPFNVSIRFCRRLDSDNTVEVQASCENIQIEEGTTATSYEPYKSSTVTTSKIQLTEAMFEQGSVDETRDVGISYANMKNTTEEYYKTRIRTVTTYKVKPNTDYQLKLNSNYRSFIVCFNDGKYMSHITWNTQGTRTFTVPSNCNEIALVFCFVNGTSILVSEFLNMGVELAEILTLRGIGDIKDELDLQTGKLTQRVGEVVLDGSEDWRISGSTRPNHLRLYFTTTRFKQNQNVINDKFADNGDIKDRDIEGIYMSNTIDIQVEHSRLSEISVNGFKNWLRENNIKVQAILSQESVKTVDLTVVNQDNQPTELGTFENVTHVSLEAENLIPEVEMEVATHISEELASVSPLMNDISTEQQQLETTVDEQSNNVDATMIATTEIFEDTL